uniref:Uncharacterized protein n=1 Tax=Serinus canaria TaxID=9135 RepID=A0A8C9NW54_SERCA
PETPVEALRAIKLTSNNSNKLLFFWLLHNYLAMTSPTMSQKENPGSPGRPGNPSGPEMPGLPVVPLQPSRPGGPLENDQQDLLFASNTAVSRKPISSFQMATQTKRIAQLLTKFSDKGQEGTGIKQVHLQGQLCIFSQSITTILFLI